MVHYEKHLKTERDRLRKHVEVILQQIILTTDDDGDN